MKYLQLSIVALLISISFTAAPAYGCVCDVSVPFQKHVEQSTAIFSAKYIGSEYREGISNERVNEILQMDGEKKPYKTLVYKFQANNWWKGDLLREVIIVTDNVTFADGSQMVSDCGLSFETGQNYLVFASGEKNNLHASACSLTKNLKRAKSDLKILGKGKKAI